MSGSPDDLTVEERVAILELHNAIQHDHIQNLYEICKGQQATIEALQASDELMLEYLRGDEGARVH